MRIPISFTCGKWIKLPDEDRILFLNGTPQVVSLLSLVTLIWVMCMWLWGFGFLGSLLEFKSWFSTVSCSWNTCHSILIDVCEMLCLPLLKGYKCWALWLCYSGCFIIKSSANKVTQQLGSGSETRAVIPLKLQRMGIWDGKMLITRDGMQARVQHCAPGDHFSTRG